MKFQQMISLCAAGCVSALLVGCGSASAGNFGTFTEKGKTVSLNSGYAYRIKGEKVTKVVICDVDKIDAKALDAEDYRYNALYQQISKTHPARSCVDLSITADGQLYDLTTNTMNGMKMGIASQNRPDRYKLEIKHNDDKRIEGTLRSTDELKKEKDVEFDVKFSLDVSPTPAFS
ncbi:MAG: hypothetical protein ABJB01_00235 [Rudaea sp.]